ncbi:MAG: hypothetical protein ACRYGF_18690 [Janthinobacterium lividum]
MAKAAAKQTKKQAAKRIAATPASSVGAAVKAKKIAKRQQLAPAMVTSLTHGLESLLHTMRSIAQHEDELCTLLHDARRTGKISAPLLRELKVVLDALPAEEYTSELQAIKEVTEAA